MGKPISNVMDLRELAKQRVPAAVGITPRPTRHSSLIPNNDSKAATRLLMALGVVERSFTGSLEGSQPDSRFERPHMGDRRQTNGILNCLQR